MLVLLPLPERSIMQQTQIEGVNYFIKPLSREETPTVFQVYDDRKYFRGQLIYSQDRWRFFENNGPDNPILAKWLGKIVTVNQ